MSVTQSVELKHILFVDDDWYLLEGLRDAMRPQRRRWTMSFVSSGEEALSLLAEQEHDIVISDLRMPEMDGAAFLTRARELQPNSARIIISAYADIEGIMRAINDAGIFRFVTKPWSDHELKTAIVQVLAYRALLVENQEFANEVRRQRGIITEQQAELDRLELETPGITRVRWTEDGGVLLEE